MNWPIKLLWTTVVAPVHGRPRIPHPPRWVREDQQDGRPSECHRPGADVPVEQSRQRRDTSAGEQCDEQVGWQEEDVRIADVVRIRKADGHEPPRHEQ